MCAGDFLGDSASSEAISHNSRTSHGARRLESDFGIAISRNPLRHRACRAVTSSARFRQSPLWIGFGRRVFADRPGGGRTAADEPHGRPAARPVHARQSGLPHVRTGGAAWPAGHSIGSPAAPRADLRYRASTRRGEITRASAHRSVIALRRPEGARAPSPASCRRSIDPPCKLSAGTPWDRGIASRKPSAKSRPGNSCLMGFPASDRAPPFRRVDELAQRTAEPS
jgi:hypothetical protein